VLKLSVKRCLFGILSTSLIFLTFGCAVLAVGGAAAGAGAGTYLYVNGELKTDYPYSFDKVWSACERAVADMRGTAVEPKKEIGHGTISTKIKDEPVKVTIMYKDKNLTTVGIRVGIMGNQASAKVIHDRVSYNLLRD